MTLKRESLGTWVLGLVLADLVVGLCFLSLIQGLADPAFGPPFWLRAWAGAYEACHLPLGIFIPKLQSDLGFLGIFAQGWLTPEAQGVRLLVFAANSALVALGLHFLLARRAQGTHSAGVQPLLSGRLRQTLFQGQVWRAFPGSAYDQEQLQKCLEFLEWRLGKVDLDRTAIRDLRAQALYYWGQVGQELRPWLALGRSTLHIAEALPEGEAADGLAFGQACLRLAHQLEPENPLVWRALLEWRVLPLETMRDAPPAALAELGALREIWDLSLQPLDEAEKRAQWEARWPHATESLRLRAESLEAAGQSAAALELWRVLVREKPAVQRWRQRAAAILRSQGLPEDQWKLTAPGAALAPQPDWLYRTQRPLLRTPWLPRIGRVVTAAALLLLPIRPLKVLAQPLFERANWAGSWNCRAVISPFGEIFTLGRLPATLTSYLPADACGYTAITALAFKFGMNLEYEGTGDINLEEQHQVTWTKSAWGAAVHLDGIEGPNTLNLRNREQGIEVSIPGQSWTLYLLPANFQPEIPPDRAYSVDAWGHVQLKGPGNLKLPGHEAPMDDWLPVGMRKKPVLPPVYQTSRGVYLDLKERGWTRLGMTVDDLPVYEGVNSDIVSPPDTEAVTVLAQWSRSYTAPRNYQAPAFSQQSECGRCSRANSCGPAVSRPVNVVQWLRQFEAH